MRSNIRAGLDRYGPTKARRGLGRAGPLFLHFGLAWNGLKVCWAFLARTRLT
jgi:hypothetical protein